MKIAIVYNRDSQRVINLFGLPNKEKYGLKAIQRITNSLKKNRHQVGAFEGDKDLFDRLEEFMPRVIKGERPGMVFNLSYGIQGQARYTHVPGMLEMVGLPYVGSGPLAHSLALDKVVSKMIFIQHGLPTPDFAVLDSPDFDPPLLKYPMIVKPKNESVSFGIKVVRSERELRDAAGVIFQEFQQPVLVEQYIPGREINVGLLGNGPTEALPPAEIVFGPGGPQIYTLEDKTRRSGREITIQCPADLDDDLQTKAKELAVRAFQVLGCCDCARVDMRLDESGQLHILEVNSLPSLGEHGSYVQEAAAVGLDFTGLVNRLVDIAASRYFGMPSPPDVVPQRATPGERIVTFLTERRDEIEREVEDWVHVRSRTSDPVGIGEAAQSIDRQMRSFGLKPVDDLTDSHVAWTWESSLGLDGGVLIVSHLDVPIDADLAAPMFRREPERLFGEGIGVSRAPLASISWAIRAVRRIRRMNKLKVGVMIYADEGHDCRYSSKLIALAAGRAKQVLVMRPGNVGDQIVTARRGQRRYRLRFEGKPMRLGMASRKPEVLSWAFEKLQLLSQLSSRKDRVAVSTLDLRTSHLPMLLPHMVAATLLVTYPDEKAAHLLEDRMREILNGKTVPHKLELVSSRPPMKERRATDRLAKAMTDTAREWEIPLPRESSVWPSVAGLVPASVGVVCGLGPVAQNIYTTDESVDRVSLLQRTLLLAQFLAKQTK
ncbi:MAG: ATP-grasp domain-containing protein [Planctomycetales bacterium]